MKKLFLFCLMCILFPLPGYTFSDGNTNHIYITGSTSSDITGSGNGGKLVFPDSSNGVYVDVTNFRVNNTSDIQVHGSFWLSNLSDSSDLSLGWATFDIGTSFLDSVTGLPAPQVQPVVFKNNGDGTLFTGSGYAWSKSAGWIYFSPTNLISGNNNTKVTYTKSTGIMNGCTWSQNLGWICIDNFILDTTPPDIIGITGKPIAAIHNGSFVFNEALSEIKIDDTTTGVSYIDYTTSLSGDKKTVNNISLIRAKNYNISVSDLFGNTSTGQIQVVANVPSILQNSSNIGSASTYTSTLGSTKIGNGGDTHSLDIKLRDTYGNPVINVSGIKDVSVELGFLNTVDFNQVSNYDLGDAIVYGVNDFWLNTIMNNGTASNSTDGNFSAQINSYAPTSSGYIETTLNNNIGVNVLNIKVDALSGNSGVGEISQFSMSHQFPGNFKFTPAVQITGLIKDSIIARDYEASFTGTVSITPSSGKSISNLNTVHYLDLGDSNIYISMQNLSGGNSGYIGYNKPNTGNTGYSYSSVSSLPSEFSPVGVDSKSIIHKSYSASFSSTTSLIDTLKATPKVVLSGRDLTSVNYNSELSYTIEGKLIVHPSYKDIFSNAVVNREVKIAGITNTNTNNLSVIDSSSIQFVGSLSHLEFVTQVHKNAVTYQKNGSSNGVFYKNGDYTFSSWSDLPSGTHTIIVDGDITISGNINKVVGSIKSIVALKKADGTGGNIWVKNNVQFVGAVLFTDKAVLSGEYPSSYYTDTASSKDQLFIKGSVIANNTIGGASKNPATCPYYISTCDETIAKRYDWNHFRAFMQGVIGNNSVPTTTPYGDFTPNMLTTGYDTAPLIIEYDSELQKNTPNIFKGMK